MKVPLFPLNQSLEESQLFCLFYCGLILPVFNQENSDNSMRFVSIICFFLPLCISAQDISGVWTGYIKTPGSQLEYELAISNGDKKLSGYSLIIYPKDGIENIGIKTAKIKQTKKEIYFEDDELVYDNFTTQPRRVKMFGNLWLTMKDTLMILRGNFSTRSLDFRDTRTYSGEVYLQKTARPLSSKMLITMDEINLVHNLSFLRPKKVKQVRQATTTDLKKEKTGAIKLNEQNKAIRAGGVKYTIKDGIVYDAKKLLADVKKIVDDEKAKTNWKLRQPGVGEF